MSASTADWAVRYIEEYQFRLVAIPKGTRGPWILAGTCLDAMSRTQR